MDFINENIVILNNIKNSIISKTDIQKNISIYIQEVVEVFIIYFLYALLTSKETFQPKRAMKIALIVGFITFLAELYEAEFKRTIKTGILSAIGVGMIKNIS